MPGGGWKDHPIVAVATACGTRFHRNYLGSSKTQLWVYPTAKGPLTPARTKQLCTRRVLNSHLSPTESAAKESLRNSCAVLCLYGKTHHLYVREFSLIFVFV